MDTTQEDFYVNKFVEYVNNEIKVFWERAKYTIDIPRVVSNILSDKWIRLEKQELRDDGKGGKEYKTVSVYCFIARKDYTTKALGNVNIGGIYKAAGFKLPAKHMRGNIFDSMTYNCADAYGIVYLSPGRKV